MFDKELDAFAAAAQAKYRMSKETPFRFLMSAVIAGFFIVIATILSNVTAAVFYKTSPETAKFLGSFLFSIAIILIVMIGGDLFTGNNMTMAMGMYNKKVSFGQTLWVWVMSYIGNFIGAFALSGLFVLSGCCNSILKDYYTAIIPAKLDLDPLTFFIRGILCNFLVCLAVFVGKRMTSESGKLTVMFCIITTFVMAGFEHCIANISTFTISGFILGGLPADKLALSFIFVTLGNIVGGAVLLAGPLKLASSKNK